MRRIQPVQQRAGQRQQRKAADAAGALLIGAGVELLEGEAEEEPEAEEQQQADDGRSAGHRRADPAPSRWLGYAVGNQDEEATI